VRVRLRRDGVDARCRFCPLAGEPAEGEVEAVPEEVHGAGLAAVPTCELLEHVGARLKDVEESGDGGGVVARVVPVRSERSCRRHAEGLCPDVDAHVEVVEGVAEVTVEVGDGDAVVQLEACFRFCGAGPEPVVDEIDLDLEVVGLDRHAPGGQSAS
jgi:hypothetical protein